MYANNVTQEAEEPLTDMVLNENDAKNINNSINKEDCNNTKNNQSDEESLDGSVNDSSDDNFELPYKELRRCAQTESEQESHSDNSDQQRDYSKQDDGEELIEDNQNKEPEITKTSPSKSKIHKKVINYCHRVNGIRVLTETLYDNENFWKINEMKSLLKSIMFEWKIYCPLTIEMQKEEYSKKKNFYGHCSVAYHSVRYKFNVTEVDSNEYEILCFSNEKFEKKCELSFEIDDSNSTLDRNLKVFYGDSKLYPKYSIVSEEIDEKKTSSKPNVPSDITDLTQLWLKERSEPDPFFQKFSIPLHVLMFSKSQLNVIDHSRSAIILHLDGTGGNVKPWNEVKEKHIFYYALLYRAKARTIPLCELITSQHNIPSISTMLREYRQLVETVENKWPFFNAIVTDWSWVLMNSILEEWNRMSMNTYLDIAYSYLIDEKKKKPVSMTILLSCCAHVMNRLSRRLKKIPTLKNNRDLFMDSMALMILARSIDEMDSIFEDFMSAILTKDKKTAGIYIKRLTEKKTKKEEINDIVTFCEKTDDSGENEVKLSDFIKLSVNKNDSVYRNSPFFSHYESILTKVFLKFQEENIPLEQIDNVYYSTEIPMYLLKSFMAYCPLWSGMMLDLVDSSISCVTNAYAESHMKRYSDKLLKQSRQWTVGDVYRILKKSKNNFVKEDRFVNAQTASKINANNYELYRTTTLNSLDTEKWDRAIKNDQKTNIKKRKVSHITGRKLKRIKENLENSDKDMNNSSSDGSSETDREIENKKIEITRKREKGKTKKVTKKSEAKDIKESSNFGSNEYLQPNRKSIVDTCTVQEATNKIQEVMLENGTISDVTYYINLRSANIKLAYYKPKIKEFQICREYILTAQQYRETIYLKGTIDGEVIDMFTLTHISCWENRSYFSTDVGCEALDDRRKRKQPHCEQIYDLNKSVSDVILMPYRYKSHWRLLVIDQKENTLELIDPYERTTDVKRVFKSFIMYTNECNKNSSLELANDQKWTMKDERNHPFMQIYDKWNSAIYICYFIRCVGLNINMDSTFDPDVFRKEIVESITKNSENLKDKCIFCLEEDADEKNKKTCTICKRWLHFKCISYDQVNSDDEEKLKNEEFDYDPFTNKELMYTVLHDLKYQCRACKKYLNSFYMRKT